MAPSAAPDEGRKSGPTPAEGGDLPNLGLLIKLLKMTTSNTDGEALSAMRKANEQLAKFGGDWESLLRGKVTVIGDPFADMPAPPQRHQQAAPPPPRRPTPPPPPQAARFFGQLYPQARSRPQASAPRPAPAPKKPTVGPTGGRTRSNLYAGPCVKCGNNTPEQMGFSLHGTSWNTTNKWQVCCSPCFYAGAPAGFAGPSGKPHVTNIDLDSLA